MQPVNGELLRIIRDIDACTSDSILDAWGEGTYQIPLRLLRRLKSALRANDLSVGKGELKQ